MLMLSYNIQQNIFAALYLHQLLRRNYFDVLMTACHKARTLG